MLAFFWPAWNTLVPGRLRLQGEDIRLQLMQKFMLAGMRFNTGVDHE